MLRGEQRAAPTLQAQCQQALLHAQLLRAVWWRPAEVMRRLLKHALGTLKWPHGNAGIIGMHARRGSTCYCPTASTCVAA